MTDIHQTTLPNGLRVVLSLDDSAPLVGMSMLYDVGSRVEVRGSAGFAHLFEHMMFQGSEHLPNGDFMRRVHALGGHANGSTSRERTNFYMSLPSHELGLGLWMEADRLRALRLSSDTLENQRKTVLEERLQKVDNSPYGPAHVKINEISYRDFAYAHPVIGYREDIEGADLAGLQAFYEAWYRPNNVVLAIVGSLDIERTLDQVHALFGGIGRGNPIPRPHDTESPRMQTAVHRMDDELAHMPALFVNHQSVPYGDPDFFVYEVIETLLFRGPSSRLIRRMVIEDSSAVHLTGGYEAHRGPSLFSFFAVLPKGGSPMALAEACRAAVRPSASEPT